VARILLPTRPVRFFAFYRVALTLCASVPLLALTNLAHADNELLDRPAGCSFGKGSELKGNCSLDLPLMALAPPAPRPFWREVPLAGPMLALVQHPAACPEALCWSDRQRPPTELAMEATVDVANAALLLTDLLLDSRPFQITGWVPVSFAPTRLAPGAFGLGASAVF